MRMTTLKLEQIVPYERNPRINDNAVDAVAESIKQCSYIQPIMVDENYVILGGHTRLKALKQLGYEECQVIIIDGLSEEQKKKFRFLDNKTGELAEWDLAKLEEELEQVDLGELDFFNLGNEEFYVDTDNDHTGAVEYEIEGFDDEQFKYECQNCGFKFN